MIPHGRHSKYSNDKCRCDACREAWSDYVRDIRQRRKLHGQAGGFVVPHGTKGGYTNYDCRCGPCAQAVYEYKRALARARRASKDQA